MLTDTRQPQPAPWRRWRELPWRMIRWFAGFFGALIAGIVTDGWLAFGLVWVATAIGFAWCLYGLVDSTGMRDYRQ